VVIDERTIFSGSGPRKRFGRKPLAASVTAGWGAAYKPFIASFSEPT
jgi:hypothetical protein